MSAKKPAKIRPGRTDWARIDTLTDEEIERMAAADIDNPITEEKDWANAFIGLPPLKTPVNAKFDVDVVEWFKSQGRGYQTRMMPFCASTWKRTARRDDRLHYTAIGALIAASGA